MSFIDTLDKILKRYASIAESLCKETVGSELVRLSKELSSLENVVSTINKYKKSIKELDDLNEMQKDVSLDEETKFLVEEEVRKIESLIPRLEHDIKIALIPKDAMDEKNSIIEVRAGTGGDEAGLFAANLFLMYQRYAERNKWKFEIMAISETGVGGIKEASALISGAGAFSKLKYESGVHRVQRVPETESSGRIHTSAATVAVLPEVEDVDIKIDEKDITIDTYRASGAGGQHVNTTDSAVRITHIPSGIVVAIQDERSQHKNKASAMKLLRARLYEFESEKQHKEISLSRKSQVGSGDRSERIRTYNFPQNRVTDHRINLTLYKIESIVKFGDLDEFTNALMTDDQAKKLSEM